MMGRVVAERRLREKECAIVKNYSKLLYFEYSWLTSFLSFLRGLVLHVWVG